MYSNINSNNTSPNINAHSHPSVLPKGCTSSGKIVTAELPQPAGGDPYGYRVYLPPCYDAESESRYPVLFLIPGSVSSPDSWLQAGLPREMNTGTDDSGMLERARAMKSILDEEGVENELYVDDAGHHYKYWIPNFEMYLTWMAEDW